MAYLDDHIYDNGLTGLAGSNRVLHICSAEPSSFANVAAVTLGNKSAPTIGAPEDRAGGGREVEVSAISDGSVTGTGTASHWALVDTANTRLLAAENLGTSQVVTAGNDFTLTAFTIGIPDPA
jgi:hypothetical protein